MQRHIEDDDVEAKICGSGSPVVILEIKTLVGEYKSGVEGCLEGMTLKNIQQNCDKKPH